MVDNGAACALPLATRLARLRALRPCPLPSAVPATDATWGPSPPGAQVQVMMCDGALVRCARCEDGESGARYQVDMRLPDGGAPRKVVVRAEHAVHVEAVDLAQDLLVVSERTEGSQCVCSAACLALASSWC